jgi:hypothetical protein
MAIVPTFRGKNRNVDTRSRPQLGFHQNNLLGIFRKFMLTIVWNLRGFHFISVLEKERKFNTMHYVTEIVSLLFEWRASDASESNRKLIVFADNARPHTARLSVEFFEDNQMKMAPHPPYSPDIAAPDFYLSGYIKRCLASRLFVDGEELFEAVRGIVDSIDKVALQVVFLERMGRLRKYIQTNGEYTE